MDDRELRAFPVRLGDRGRLVLPAELRRAAGLQQGDELMASLHEDGVHLVSRRELARAGRGAFAHLLQGRSAVRTATRQAGLSLGDRACLALARQRRESVLTAVRSWAALDVGFEVLLIR